MPSTPGRIRRSPSPGGAAPEERLARSTLGGYLPVRAGQTVVVESWTHALPWARAFVVEARRRGADPILALEDEDGYFRSLRAGGRVPTAPALLAPGGAAYVYLGGPEAFPRLLGLGPRDLTRALDRHGGAWGSTARSARLRGVRLAIAGVTPTAAARFGVDVEAWRAEVLAASLVPPHRLAATASRVLRRLARAATLSIRHENGSRLELPLRPGSWTEEAGRPTRAGHRSDAVWSPVPAGRVVVPVRPRRARGTWESNRPTYERFGETPVALGAQVDLREGRVASASFDRGGEEFVRSARRRGLRSIALTAVSVGLNPEVSRAPEIGEFAYGTLGLRFRFPDPAAGVRDPPHERTFLLQGAEADLDGEPWLVGGREVRPHR